MKSIKLTQNKITWVDDRDYDKLSKYKWCAKESGGKKFYAIRRKSIVGSHIYMHKEIMNFPERYEVDHINGNTLDNRRSNLRVCSHKQNIRNQKLSAASSSGYKGVSQVKSTKRWMAYIKVNQKRIYLGTFEDKINAAIAYNEAAKKHFGEFARLNETV